MVDRQTHFPPQATDICTWETNGKLPAPLEGPFEPLHTDTEQYNESIRCMEYFGSPFSDGKRRPILLSTAIEPVQVTIL